MTSADEPPSGRCGAGVEVASLGRSSSKDVQARKVETGRAGERKGHLEERSNQSIIIRWT